MFWTRDRKSTISWQIAHTESLMNSNSFRNLNMEGIQLIRIGQWPFVNSIWRKKPIKQFSTIKFCWSIYQSMKMTIKNYICWPNRWWLRRLWSLKNEWIWHWRPFRPLAVHPFHSGQCTGRSTRRQKQSAFWWTENLECEWRTEEKRISFSKTFLSDRTERREIFRKKHKFEFQINFWEISWKIDLIHMIDAMWRSPLPK